MMKSSYTPVDTQDADTAPDPSAAALLEETLIGVPRRNELSALGQTLVEVVAPASLPEGYEFQVVVGNLQFPVQVPPGGIEEGQKFSVPVPAHHHSTTSSLSVPVGHWRDGLNGIFNYGACHPHCWTACCCAICKYSFFGFLNSPCGNLEGVGDANKFTVHQPTKFLQKFTHTFPSCCLTPTTVAAGQVIRRLQFTWRGTPSRTAAASARAFAIIFYITLFHWGLFAFAFVTIAVLDPNDRSKPEPITGWIQPTGMLKTIMVSYDIAKYVYYGLTVWLLYNLRVSLRNKYAIPGAAVDDCCCSCWCPCLVAGQMLRHTTDYDIYPSQLCTATGLPNSAPMIV